MTPSARSRRHLAELGYHVATVEQRIPHSFITRDAFGWADLLAHGWAKRGARGARKVWTLREIPVTLEHLQPQEASA